MIVNAQNETGGTSSAGWTLFLEALLVGVALASEAASARCWPVHSLSRRICGPGWRPSLPGVLVKPSRVNGAVGDPSPRRIRTIQLSTTLRLTRL